MIIRYLAGKESRMSSACLSAIAVLSLATSAFAGAPVAHDKRHDHLFRPTPREAMRPLSTDRPDVTESAYTVDAGHFQIEMDLVSYTRDAGEESWAFANTNLKLGLTSWADLQVVAPIHEWTRGGDSGFGDLTFRLKMNLWGNDGGDTAFAVMPYVTLPTAHEGPDLVEGGLILVFAAGLPGDWNFGVMAVASIVGEEEGGGHDWEYLTTMTLGRTIIGDLGGFVELIGESGPSRPWAATFSTGLTYGLTENVQLDAAVRIGLNRAADDFTPLLGLSVRF